MNVSLLRRTKDKVFYDKYRRIIEDYFIEVQDDFDIYVKTDDLSKINTKLFDIGLHGHEHQRFSMYDIQWQQSNLEKDIETLSRFESYKPIFAIPFGRNSDWDFNTIKICLDFDLKFVFANGGINTGKEIGLKRIPSDNQNLKKLIKNTKF
jgi:peptidoglycan/xylan/chitin deacetylase (PgdA/CDA1 family)